MITVTNIQTSKTRTTITLSADIVFPNGKTQQMYFSTDRKFEKFLATDASPFLAAMLIPSMKKHENLFIDGVVSPQLLKNTAKIMAQMEEWNLGIGLQPITVTAKKTKKDSKKPKFQGTFFSGGVDSFYTYLKNRSKISHLVLVHGFDIPLENTSFYENVKKTVTSIAKEEKKEIISITTNAAEIIEPLLIWDFGHGGALAAVGLLLRGGLQKIYISAAVRTDQLFPYGTHPDLDKYWSTERLEVIHFGNELCRMEKIVYEVGQSPLALKHLRVCTQNIAGKYNCSECFKCLVTMIGLVGAGTFIKTKTFTRKIDLKKVRNMYYDYEFFYNMLGEKNLEILHERGIALELQKAISYSLEESKKKKTYVKRFVRFLAHLDQAYNERRVYQFVFKLNKQQDRSVLFKLMLNKGIIK